MEGLLSTGPTPSSLVQASHVNIPGELLLVSKILRIIIVFLLVLQKHFVLKNLYFGPWTLDFGLWTDAYLLPPASVPVPALAQLICSSLIFPSLQPALRDLH